MVSRALFGFRSGDNFVTLRVAANQIIIDAGDVPARMGIGNQAIGETTLFLPLRPANRKIRQGPGGFGQMPASIFMCGRVGCAAVKVRAKAAHSRAVFPKSGGKILRLHNA